MAEISEEAQEQQYTSFSSSSSSPIAAPEVDPDEESLASVLAKKSPMPFLEAANAEKWVKDAAQRTESDAPPNDLSHQTRRRPRPSRSQTLKMVSTYYKYSWTWTLQDVTISIPVPQGT